MTKTGFTSITEEKLGESSHADLRGLEHATRMPEGFLALESMIIAAKKPA